MRKIKNSSARVKVKTNSNLTLNIVFSVIVSVLAIGIFYALSTALATEKYYVINQDLAAKTQVTETMLKEIVTAKGSAPQNAINLPQVKQGTVYTKIPLKAGDILSESNTGLNLDSSTGIPDDWSVTSFNVNSDSAVGGNIQKGDYFDIIGVSKEDGAKYLFYNVLALEVNRTENASEVNKDGKVVAIGEQMQYIVGLPADKVTELQAAIAKYGGDNGIKLVLAPKSVSYKERKTDNLNKTVLNGPEQPVDLYKGTDNTFKAILRDEKGRPVTKESCAAGEISPNSLCAQIEQNGTNHEKK